MICFPNAKINIGLHIVSRREDGYHNLETLFYPIGLKDALEIIPFGKATKPPFSMQDTAKTGAAPVVSGTTLGKTCETTPEHRFFQTGIPVAGAPEDNLVIKALRVIANKRTIPPIDIHLLKKIPSGAGLGGGSSDAAFMLRSLNDTFRLGFTKEELARMAASGADCAFFIHNQPALATGIGDRLEPIDLNLSNYFLLVVQPEIAISTKEAYAMVTPTVPKQSLKEIINRPVQEWKGLIKNDFESPVFKKYPEIHQIKQQLYEMGAVYASMSGSGSSVYALFEREPEWRQTFRNYFTWSSAYS